jgi:hypothetical protein
MDRLRARSPSSLWTYRTLTGYANATARLSESFTPDFGQVAQIFAEKFSN